MSRARRELPASARRGWDHLFKRRVRAWQQASAAGQGSFMLPFLLRRVRHRQQGMPCRVNRNRSARVGAGGTGEDDGMKCLSAWVGPLRWQSNEADCAKVATLFQKGTRPILTLEALLKRATEIKRLTRSKACHCGNRRSTRARQRRAADEGLRPVPASIACSKLHEFEKCVCNVFVLPDLLASLVDTRGEQRKFPPSMSSTACFTPPCCASRASMLSKGMKESDFHRLLGRHPTTIGIAQTAESSRSETPEMTRWQASVPGRADLHYTS
jgi:hypothetical protein